MSYDTIRTVLTVIAFAFVAFLTLRADQDSRKNWAMFYATLFVAVALPVVNKLCMMAGFWSFSAPSTSFCSMPIDLYFLWVVCWGVVPIFFLQYKQPFIVIVVVLWLDILLMPVLEQAGILSLSTDWLVGEVALIGLVFVPSYCWSTASYHNKWVGLRASLQVICIICVFVFGLPMLLQEYGLVDAIDFTIRPILFQLFLIIAFPGLVAVVDLVQKGKGTPFPYDKTTVLLQTGVYAYIKNPMQWSFTFIFFPMAVYHDSWYVLLGALISVLYSVTVADVQEVTDMDSRFGSQWRSYRSQVPSWYFQWRPLNIPPGTIYLDHNCSQCSKLLEWFQSRKTHNLTIDIAANAPLEKLSKVAYVDHTGQLYLGVSAIAHALEHIHLSYATLGWFMRFPLISRLLDAIVYSMAFGPESAACDTD